MKIRQNPHRLSYVLIWSFFLKRGPAPSVTLYRVQPARPSLLTKPARILVRPFALFRHSHPSRRPFNGLISIPQVLQVLQNAGVSVSVPTIANGWIFFIHIILGVPDRVNSFLQKLARSHACLHGLASRIFLYSICLHSILLRAITFLCPVLGCTGYRKPPFHSIISTGLPEPQVPSPVSSASGPIPPVRAYSRHNLPG